MKMLALEVARSLLPGLIDHALVARLHLDPEVKKGLRLVGCLTRLVECLTIEIHTDVGISSYGANKAFPAEAGSDIGCAVIAFQAVFINDWHD
jgi:hypothetical protein